MLEFSGAVDSMHQAPCKLKIAELWNTSWQEQAEKCTRCPRPCRCKKVPVKGAKALTPVGLAYSSRVCRNEFCTPG